LSTTRKLLVPLFCVLGAASLWAQLPTARLLTVFPPGGKVGSTCEVTVAGIDLDDARVIYFSHSNITAAAQTNGAGKFLVSIGANVPVGTYDARVIGRYGMSNPRAFVVGDLEEGTEKDNDSFQSATEVSLGSTMNGRAEAHAVDYFKFQVTSGQRIAISCEAPKIDSRMDPSLILYDDVARELKQSRRGGLLEFTATRNGPYVVKVHDFLFGGGNEHFYRLSIRTDEDMLKREHQLDEPAVIKPPCEVSGQFYPAGDVDSYAFEAKKGDVWWVEVFSQRMGLPTDPQLLINDQEFNDIEANVGGVEFKTSSLDPVGRFEAKEDGTCRIQLRDLFNRAANDPRLAYRLVVRKETPDFELIANPRGPLAKKDSREIPVWTSALRRGETIPVRAMALRRDGFKGEISVQATGLPPGTASSELVLGGEQNSGILLITAAESATNWAGTISIVGKASVGMRVAKAATLIWNVPDYNNEAVRARFTDSYALAICDELAPISVVPAEQKLLEVPATGKLAIPLKVTRRGEFNETFKLKAAGVAALDSLKEIEIKEKATNTVVELDLTQQKLTPGSYTFYLQGETKGKYRNPAEGEKGKTKDVTIIVYSSPIALKVSPPQTAAK
jgi:hypothetical protein